MNNSIQKNFTLKQIGAYGVYQYEPWIHSGIIHGFIGATGNFSDSNLKGERIKFCEAFGVDAIMLPTQTHSDTVLDVSSADCKEFTGDALIGSLTNRGDIIAYGIRTADCLPLFVRVGSRFGLIHAGWRGLANGIIQKTVNRFLNTDNIEILIGPAAGSDKYEVGEEVVEAIGPTVKAKAISPGKYHLDLQGSAKNSIVGTYGSRVTVECLELCTITNETFHSFRRQGAARGSNLGFFIPSKSLARS